MIASFDVGITNLAICIINSEEILKWELINLTSANNICCKILRNKKKYLHSRTENCIQLCF